MTQKGLADSIIDTLYPTNETVSAFDTPCTKYLALNKDGKLAQGDFEYCSIVGQLNYLQGHSQYDITMKFSQVACFCTYSHMFT